KLATWIWAQTQIARALDSAKTARPNREADLTPINKSLNPDRDPRASELCRLWRDRLTADDPIRRQAAGLSLRAFEEHERRLKEEWTKIQQMEENAALGQALHFSGSSATLLSSLLTGVAAKSDPVLEQFYA